VIRKAARGEAVLHPRVAARVIQEVRGTLPEAPNPFTELSDRELEVLRLVAGGLSNARIAESLVISEKPVKGHVSYPGQAAPGGSNSSRNLCLARRHHAT